MAMLSYLVIVAIMLIERGNAYAQAVVRIVFRS